MRAAIRGKSIKRVRRVGFRIGRQRKLDRSRPYTRVFRGRHRGPSHVHKVRVGVRLKSGRLIRKSTRFRTCPSR